MNYSETRRSIIERFGFRKWAIRIHLRGVTRVYNSVFEKSEDDARAAAIAKWGVQPGEKLDVSPFSD